ncbi:MAG TPA: pilus assembly protein [Chloroflexi bacterium]|nr:MAG: pilus assembly protein [Chloroflexota bacterium]HDN05068.1 pilus assembly protein [Chloroflexota bacterium]
MVAENGQGLVEYSLILLLVALALILILSIFGTELADVYSNIIDQIP